MMDISTAEYEILMFLRIHPEVTVILKYDNKNDSFQVGMNFTKDGKFHRKEFKIKWKTNDFYETLNIELNNAYTELMGEGGE